MPITLKHCLSLAVLVFATGANAESASGSASGSRDLQVRERIQTVMRQYDIPGMVVAITEQGRHRFYSVGQATRTPATAVSADTLFEVGSISKTFTATLAAVVEVEGHLRLQDRVADAIPSLADSAFGQLPLLALATHTTGGLPLQVPDAIDSYPHLLRYLQAWQPEHAPGRYRTYSNISIGLLGVIAAQALAQPYDRALAQQIFEPLGMHHSFIDVPASQQRSYAFGYTKDNREVRVNPGVLAAEAYGVKTSARDMLRFVDANLGRVDPHSVLGRAIAMTHTGYYRAGPFAQALIWEQYPSSAPLAALVDGNASSVITQGLPATAIDPPQPAPAASWINKTGSTNGFGAYVAFMPARQKGIVILANKNYPNEARVRLAYALLN